jgi:nitronate monooxygenase
MSTNVTLKERRDKDMVQLPNIFVRGLDRAVILIQGGMGAGVSLACLAGAVAQRGGVGTVSFVALDRFVERRIGRTVGHREAAKLEIEEARRLSMGRGAIAINCMVLIEKTYIPSIEGAIEGGVDIVIAGAGLPMTLPEIVGNAPTALVPIISSGRTLETICRRWSRYGRMPDAVILEGPLAGGHLGFKAEDILKPEFQLESLFGSVKKVAVRNGNFPVIVAGGIFSREDIVHWINAGADGVQIGTRFAATHESGASEDFKRAIVASRAEDIEVAVNPGSPSGMPFRVIRSSPGYVQALAHGRPPCCDKQYLLHKGKDGRMTCLALEGYEAFCICNALLSAADCNNTADLPIFTVGANAARVDRILSVDELVDELTGASP